MGFYREVNTVAHWVLLRLDLLLSIWLNTAAKIPSCRDNIDPCAGVFACTPRQFVFRPLFQLLHPRSTLFTVATRLQMMRQTFHVMADGYYTL